MNNKINNYFNLELIITMYLIIDINVNTNIVFAVISNNVSKNGEFQQILNRTSDEYFCGCLLF